MTTTPFSVIGKRVVVAGAARSGIAAAHCSCGAARE